MGDAQPPPYAEFIQSSVVFVYQPGIEYKVNIFANVWCITRNYFKFNSAISVLGTQYIQFPSLTNPNGEIFPDSLSHSLYPLNFIEPAFNFPYDAFVRVFIWASWSRDVMLYRVLAHVLVEPSALTEL